MEDQLTTHYGIHSERNQISCIRCQFTLLNAQWIYTDRRALESNQHMALPVPALGFKSQANCFTPHD